MLVRAGATGVGVDLVAEDEHQEEGGSERTGDESSGIPAALERHLQTLGQEDKNTHREGTV